MIVRRNLGRGAMVAAIAWIVAEFLLFYSATRTIGLLATIAFMAVKGLGGLALFVIALKSILRRAVGPRRGLGDVAVALFAALGAMLILIPGFLAPLAGVALFSPSVRIRVLRWLKGARSDPTRPDVISLDQSEWREVSARRPRRAPRKVRSLAP